MYITGKMREYKLRRFGRVEKRNNYGIFEKIVEIEVVEENWERDRSKKWMEVISEDKTGYVEYIKIRLGRGGGVKGKLIPFA